MIAVCWQLMSLARDSRESCACVCGMSARVLSLCTSRHGHTKRVSTRKFCSGHTKHGALRQRSLFWKMQNEIQTQGSTAVIGAVRLSFHYFWMMEIFASAPTQHNVSTFDSIDCLAGAAPDLHQGVEWRHGDDETPKQEHHGGLVVHHQTRQFRRNQRSSGLTAQLVEKGSFLPIIH